MIASLFTCICVKQKPITFCLHAPNNQKCANDFKPKRSTRPVRPDYEIYNAKPMDLLSVQHPGKDLLTPKGYIPLLLYYTCTIASVLD